MTTQTLTPAEMTIEQIGEWLIETASADALAHLAALALRRARARAEAILTDAIGRLAGSCRTFSEADRIAAMLADAAPPADLAAAPVAPARGAMRLVDNIERLPGGARRRDGRHGRMLDQLSIMNRLEVQRHQARGKDDPVALPFDPAQIAMALRYQALVERHDAAGMKCASAEVRAVAGSGGGGDFMFAYMKESEELDMIRQRIGTGIALEVKRGSTGRRDITTRALVDAVCLHGMDLTAVLRAHGWSNGAPYRNTLRTALAGALDRMQGYLDKGA